MSGDAPSITVIIPVFNAAETISAAVESVLAQSCGDWELICFDDASTDSSGAILDGFAASDPRVRVIHSPVNRRQGAGRNVGIREARGRYIFFLDADDTLMPEALSHCLRAAEATGAELVSFNYRTWFPSSGKASQEIRQLGADASSLDPDQLRRRRATNPSFIWSAMFCRELFYRCDLFFPENILYEDNAVALALQLSASPAVHLDEPLYLYRMDNVSVTRSFNNERFFDRIPCAITLLGHLRRLGLYDCYREEIDRIFIGLYLEHTVYGAIYRFDRPHVDRIREVTSGIAAFVPRWSDNSLWRAMPLKKRVKFHLHSRFPRTIHRLFTLKHRLIK